MTQLVAALERVSLDALQEGDRDVVDLHAYKACRRHTRAGAEQKRASAGRPADGKPPRWPALPAYAVLI